MQPLLPQRSYPWLSLVAETAGVSQAIIARVQLASSCTLDDDSAWPEDPPPGDEALVGSVLGGAGVVDG